LNPCAIFIILTTIAYPAHFSKINYLNGMCDTFICPPSLSATGHAIFGKNSDREPNEIQILRKYPAKEVASKQQRCTFITVEHVRQTFEVILSQPIGMWGAEMGMNEMGVCIGNEAVFTKMPMARKNTGLTGMDMLRLTLESCSTAQDALSKLIALNEKYGQDANGGYQSKFYYHNSFLIADPKEAFVLETAGPFWVVEKVKSHRAISNGLSIGSEYFDIHPEAIPFAMKKGWIRKWEDFDFAHVFSAYWMPRLAKCTMRRALNESHQKRGFGIADAFAALRSHADEDFLPQDGTTAGVCMHASGLFCPQQTTSSMVAEIRSGGNHTVWLTGSSAPCLSVFKPFYFYDDQLNEEGTVEHWLAWESWHRKAIHDYKTAHKAVDDWRRGKENAWIVADRNAANNNLHLHLQTLSAQAVQESDAFLRKLKAIPLKINSPLLYRLLWKKHQATL
jgi:dipeptidase